MIWIVNFKRFLQEYDNHIRHIDNKYVNWYIDNNNKIRLYIEQTHGNNVYYYKHDGDINDLPPELRNMVSVKGEILGYIEDDKKINEIEDKVDNVLTRLQFNTFGD